MRGIEILSLSDFRKKMNYGKYTDWTIEKHKGLAIISICGTFSKKESIVDSDVHHFHAYHDNVLNVRFDDVFYDVEIPIEGTEFHNKARAISISDSLRIVEFMRKHPNRHFIIHSLTGKSRAAAVGMALQLLRGRDVDNFQEEYDCHPNSMIFKRLSNQI